MFFNFNSLYTFFIQSFCPTVCLRIQMRKSLTHFMLPSNVFLSFWAIFQSIIIILNESKWIALLNKYWIKWKVFVLVVFSLKVLPQEPSNVARRKFLFESGQLITFQLWKAFKFFLCFWLDLTWIESIKVKNVWYKNKTIHRNASCRFSGKRFISIYHRWHLAWAKIESTFDC